MLKAKVSSGCLFRRVSDTEERAIVERAEELLARGVGIPQPENFMNGDSEDDFMGAIKIKDGLFIGDEFSAQVSLIQFKFQ